MARIVPMEQEVKAIIVQEEYGKNSAKGEGGVWQEWCQRSRRPMSKVVLKE
jgi:hypothetical protein